MIWFIINWLNFLNLNWIKLNLKNYNYKTGFQIKFNGLLPLHIIIKQKLICIKTMLFHSCRFE